MNILSLFDGISCGAVALERAGIPVTRYYASEIDKYAIAVSKKSYPDIIQLGDVKNWRNWDIVFDSKREMNRYLELKMLEKANIIKDLELQPRFLLQESFKYNDRTIRKIEYIADFKYFDNEKNKIIVEDVKGMKTDVYKLKKKLFLKKYGEKYIFKEI